NRCPESWLAANAAIAGGSGTPGPKDACGRAPLLCAFHSFKIDRKCDSDSGISQSRPLAGLLRSPARERELEVRSRLRKRVEHISGAYRPIFDHRRPHLGAA